MRLSYDADLAAELRAVMIEVLKTSTGFPADRIEFVLASSSTIR